MLLIYQCKTQMYLKCVMYETNDIVLWDSLDGVSMDVEKPAVYLDILQISLAASLVNCNDRKGGLMFVCLPSGILYTFLLQRIKGIYEIQYNRRYPLHNKHA